MSPKHSMRGDLLALERLNLAALATDIRYLDLSHDMISFMSREAYPGPPYRTWWRSLTDRDDGSIFTSYVSLDPGEFRVERPTEPQDIVFDLPPIKESRPVSGRLNAALATNVTQDTMSVERIQAEQTGRSILRFRKSGDISDLGYGEFLAKLNELGTGYASSAIEQTLYDGFFRRIMQHYFCAAMIVVGVSLRHRGCQSRHLTSDLGDPLASLLEAFPEHQDGLLGAAAEFANHHFSEGKMMLRSALAELGLRSFYNKLYWARHNFLVAMQLSGNSSLASSGLLGFRQFVAEEGVAACSTGLCYNLTEFVDGEGFGLEREVISLLSKGMEAEAQRVIDSASKPTNPLLPRRYAEFLGARGMIESGEPWASMGLRTLLELEPDYFGPDEHDDLTLIQQGIIAGYRAIGEPEQAKRAATRLTGRLVMGYLLRRE